MKCAYLQWFVHLITKPRPLMIQNMLCFEISKSEFKKLFAVKTSVRLEEKQQLESLATDEIAARGPLTADLQ